MARRISLICARPHPNPGMHSVDLAFDRLMARHGLQAEVQRYSYGDPGRSIGSERHRLEYASLEGGFDDVLASDLILYWGDFLHAHTYWLHTVHARRADPLQAAQHLLLAGQPDEVLHKTMSFGTTLIGDDLRARTVESEYRSALPAFLGRARRLWFRDPISAAQASSLRTEPGLSCLGVDCAQLLTASDYRALAGAPAAEGEYVGIYFGRLAGHIEPAVSIAGKLAKAAGLAVAWVPWLGRDSDHITTARRAIPSMASDAEDTYERLIAQVAGARLIITDAYHLCLVAWQLGVPAIGVGLGAQRAARPISDKKKEVFYLTQGLSPLYLFHELLVEPRRHAAIVRTVLDLVLEPAFVDAVTDSLAAQAAAAEADLWSEIEACLA